MRVSWLGVRPHLDAAPAELNVAKGVRWHRHDYRIKPLRAVSRGPVTPFGHHLRGIYPTMVHGSAIALNIHKSAPNIHTTALNIKSGVDYPPAAGEVVALVLERRHCRVGHHALLPHARGKRIRHRLQASLESEAPVRAARH
eukprot:9057356-Pyramimonas_sp.AAC.2